MTKEERREYNRRWREEHKEHLRNYRKEHAEQCREYHRKYYINNADKVRETNKKWREANGDRAKQMQKRYYEKNIKTNPEALAKRAIYHAEWQRKNKEKRSAYTKAYRMRKKLESEADNER